VTSLGSAPKNRRRRGNEILEFALVFGPLMAGITALMGVGWEIFANATLQRAVRVGVTYGVTVTSSQIASGCLTDNVKTQVQNNALGFLAGSTGLAQIKVHYFQPPNPNSTAALLDVSAQSTGNSPGNVIEVSVPSYSLTKLIPRIVNGYSAPDTAAQTVAVYSAGMMEPNSSTPCIGTAP